MRGGAGKVMRKEPRRPPLRDAASLVDGFSPARSRQAPRHRLRDLRLRALADFFFFATLGLS